MDHDVLTFDDPNIHPFVWQREHYAIAASAVIFGGSTLWLFNKLRKNGALTISKQTTACLRESSGYALVSWAISSAPTFIVRKLGWETCKPFFREVLFRNPYTTAAAILLPLAISGFAVAWPAKRSETLKKELWAAACLSTGTVLAPLFFQPRDVLTIIGGYVIGVTLPVAVAVSSASNFFVLNLISLLGMVGSTLFMRETGIPFILSRRHNMKIPVSSTTALNFTFGTTLLTSFVLLVGTNAFVYYVQKCHEHQEKAEEGTKKPLWMFFDGTDPITNGMIIAGSVGFVFAKLFHKILTFPRRFLKKEEKAKPKPESNAAFDLFRSLLD